MRTTAAWMAGIVVLILASGTIWWARAQAPLNPAIAAPTLTPNLITTNIPTQIIATVSITDPTLNPSSVELYRVNGDGNTLSVAQMNDDGRNGDQKPGDRVFTTVLNLNQSTPLAFGFRVSAVFRGQARTQSAVQQFVALAPHVLPVNLPPDPGASGKTTLAGIDSDNDGVRDDVQRSILFLFPASEKLRAASTQYAKALQHVLLTAGDEQQSIVNMRNALRAQTCANYTDVFVGGRLVSHKEVDALYLNTYPRARAYYTADAHFSGHFFGIWDGQEAAQCDLDPTSLLN